jgi:hypothetical protein
MGILSSGGNIKFEADETTNAHARPIRSSIGTGTSHPFEAEQG